jgi:hypothetical protein
MYSHILSVLEVDLVINSDVLPNFRVVAATYLRPLEVVVYTCFGELRATFLTNYTTLLSS